MKSVIKTTIGIIAISLASVSVSQADSNRHNRDYDRAPSKHSSKKFDRRDHKKHQYRQHRGNHLHGHGKHPRWKHVGWKRHYWEHKRFRAAKKMRRDQRAHRRAVKQMQRERAYRRALRHDYRQRRFNRDYGHVHYVAPAPRVTYRTHSRSNNVVPVIAGGIIGSSIANNVSHGDPAATLGGAIFGAVIGDAIARH